MLLLTILDRTVASLWRAMAPSAGDGTILGARLPPPPASPLPLNVLPPHGIQKDQTGNRLIWGAALVNDQPVKATTKQPRGIATNTFQ